MVRSPLNNIRRRKKEFHISVNSRVVEECDAWRIPPWVVSHESFVCWDLSVLVHNAPARARDLWCAQGVLNIDGSAFCVVPLPIRSHALSLYSVLGISQ